MSCTYRNNYYESDELFELASHTLSAIQVPLHVFGAYIIITKTPKEMGKVKFPMLLVHLTCATYDVWATILVVPIIVFPICSGYSIGVLSSIGVPFWFQAYVGLSLFFLLGPSITMFFENRFNYLVRDDSETQSRKIKRTVQHTFNFFITFVAVSPFISNMPDQTNSRRIALEILPCLPSRIVDNPKFFMLGNEYQIFIAVSLYLIFIWSQVFIYFIRTVKYTSRAKTVSKQTSHLQRQFFKAVCLQISLPFLVILAPAVYLTSTLYTKHFDIALSNMSVIMATSHGLFSTVTMLLIHKPYRAEIWRLLGKLKLVKNENLIAVNISVHSTSD
ncbi:hypothetical protein CRE_09452 [Caenorhabditis remanei]|uniref:Serpentine Receptor, class H n=1 Tax=Caenorhabditis remanei TaxID=31234 RepID=E3LIX9_CAERE|nr:hypothetical protein CRE_09452 [Caenorhabditis remanei]